MQTVDMRTRYDFRRPLREAQKERPGKPLRLRLQPTILRRGPQGAVQYRGWRGVGWTVELADAKEGAALADALAAFFTALTTRTPEQLTALLRSVPQPAVGSGHHGNQEVPA